MMTSQKNQLQKKQSQYSLPKKFVCNGYDYSLREMVLGDVPELLPIEKAAHISPWSKSNFESSIQSSHHCFVLTTKEGANENQEAKVETIVAYCISSTAADEAELLNITVAKNYRRRGLAKHLLEFLPQYFHSNIESLFLEVRESNNNAIALYESLGFHVLGQRPNYYPAKNGKGREDALIMAKSLRDFL